MDINDPETPENGNKECVEFLAEWLERAKKGAVSHVALAVFEQPDKMFADSRGSIASQSEIHVALDMLRRQIDDVCEARMAPYNSELSADNVCYNLSSGIVSFDYIPWLIGAEMRRLRLNAPAPLKIAFYRNVHSRFLDYHNQMLKNVLGPLTDMIGGVSSNTLGGKGNFAIGYREITEAATKGERVPHLKPLPHIADSVKRLLEGLRPIVITLREASHYPHRNSNLSEWFKFARYLEGRGEEVVFVRDTAKAEEDILDFSVFPAASIDLHTRLALYEQAKCNLFVANGPGTMCFHSSVPFLMFIELDPHHLKRYRPAWPEWWPEQNGINAGEQFPWFTKHQRLIWKTDTFTNLVEAYETHVSNV